MFKFQTPSICVTANDIDHIKISNVKVDTTSMKETIDKSFVIPALTNSQVFNL